MVEFQAQASREARSDRRVVMVDWETATLPLETTRAPASRHLQRFAMSGSQLQKTDVEMDHPATPNLSENWRTQLAVFDHQHIAPPVIDHTSCCEAAWNPPRRECKGESRPRGHASRRRGLTCDWMTSEDQNT